MLLRALYDFAKTTKTPWADFLPAKSKLADSPEFESRRITWAVCLDAAGKLQGFEFFTDDENEPGRDFNPAPRTLQPKDSGKMAEFLVEDFSTVFGLGEKAAALPKDKAAVKHRYFWKRIALAAKETGHPALAAVLHFRKTVKPGRPPSEVSFEAFKPRGAKSAKEQWVVSTISDQKLPLRPRANASVDCTFRVDGKFLIQDIAILNWWSRWFDAWLKGKEARCVAMHGGTGICLVSGETNVPISDSHLPKIRGVPRANRAGASLVSAEGQSFHSYGLSDIQITGSGVRSKPDASYAAVSVRAAIQYGCALNYLLSEENEDHHFKVWDSGFCACFWTDQGGPAASLCARVLKRPKPESIRRFYGSIYAGRPRELLHRQEFFSVALSAPKDSGRLIVRHWLQQPLDQAAENLKRWFDDLEICAIESAQTKPTRRGGSDARDEHPPLGIALLPAATARDAADVPADTVVQLYRAAIEGIAPSLSSLQPTLHRLEADLARLGSGVLKTPVPADVRAKCQKSKQPVPPPGQTRFALLKLILNRNRKKTDMCIPANPVADTGDPAYNCGRLLSIFDSLQRAAHEERTANGKLIKSLEGATVAERYFGSASAAPNSAFSILWRLHHHHLKKLRQKGRETTANSIKRTIMEVCAKFRQKPPPQGAVTGAPPEFPRVFTLVEQGRFALGFYHEQAARAAAIKAWLEKQKAAGNLVTEEDVSEELILSEPQS